MLRASVYAVLATALPSSLVAEALTDPAAVSSEIASEFSAGITPSWFAALPTGIQSYLLGPAASQAANATGILNSTMIGNSSSVTQVKTTTKPNGQTTIVTDAGRTTNGGGNTQTGAAASASGSSSSSQGAAPTNVIGAGIAGAVGLVGLLAL